MRAKFPDHEGWAKRNGISLHYEVFGQGDHTILFIPPWWPFTTLRCFKSQIPYFSKHYRCIAYDPLGNGQSDRSLNPDHYGADNHINNALAILDNTNTDTAILFGYSCSGSVCAALAARHPERIEAVITISTTSPLAAPHAHRPPDDFDRKFDHPTGWQKYNRHHWEHEYADFVDFFCHQIFTEAHETAVDVFKPAVPARGPSIPPVVFVALTVFPTRLCGQSGAKLDPRPGRCGG